MTSSDISILLDLDGTLIDSQIGIMASCHAALRALDHEPDPSFDLATVIGPPIDEAMRFLLAQYGDNRVAEAIAAYREHYAAIGLFESVVYPGIPETLDGLIAAGAMLHVATSKRTTFARRILDHLRLADRFTGIYGSEPSGTLHHKPELIAHLMEQEGIVAEKCVMAGDRRYDIAGARANNLRAIGVLWGYGSRDELEVAGANQLIEHPHDLISATADLMSHLRE